MNNKTLYERLGQDNLQKMVDKFYDLVVEDEILSPLFTTDMQLVRKKQFMFLSQFLGGPALYNNKFGHPRMRQRHLPHRIDHNAAHNWLENMYHSIDSLDIEDELKSDLFQRFVPVAAHMINTQ